MTTNRTLVTVAALITALSLVSFYVIQLEARVAELSSRVENLSSQPLLNQLASQLTDIRRQLSDLSSTVKGQGTEASGGTLSAAEVYERVKDSIVSVEVLVRRDLFTGGGQGSGFVYEGHIITNNHVVQGAEQIRVIFLDGSSYSARIAGSDPFSDLAVLAVSAPKSKLKPLVLGDSSALRVGDPVIAIGNPFGLSGTLTTGVVSQKGRSLTTQTTARYIVPNVIQIDAAINPGNSGGPLLNHRGEVVGITTAIASQTGTFTGIGFATPSNTIKREIRSLIETGSYDHPWLGVQGVELTPEIAHAANVNGTRGWLITSVVKNSPADRAGLRGGTTLVRIGGRTVPIDGDIVVKIDGFPIRSGDDLSSYLEENTRPGQTIEVTVTRDGALRTFQVTLGVRPPP